METHEGSNEIVRANWPQIPTELGGLGLGLVEHGLVSEQLVRSPLRHYVFGCQASDAGNLEILHRYGTPEQKARWLLPLARGELRSCFSMTEPENPGSTPTMLACRAVRDGDDFVIDGHKWFTSSADGAAFAIVMAVTDPDAPPHMRASMIIVPTDTPGFELVRNIKIMGEAGAGWASHAEIRYRDVRVPATNLLGAQGAGFLIAYAGAARPGPHPPLHALVYPCYLANSLPAGIPRIITFWNGDVTWWAQWSGTERLIKKQIVTNGAGRAKAVTVNSESARAACLSYGVRPERIHLIRYPGVDRSRFAPSSRKDARSRLGIRASHVVLCPRGIGGYLNSDVIVQAAPEILSRHPDTLFLFLFRPGSEEDLRDHRKRAETLGFGNRFRWEEHVPWESMPSYYNAADVMVSISSHDSLPNCMLEAMACGIPVAMGHLPWF